MTNEYQEFTESTETHAFHESMDALLEYEVAKRVSAKIKEYNDTLALANKTHVKMVEFRGKYAKTLEELEAAKTMFTRIGAENAEREILGGFRLNDGVYYVERKNTRTPCITCKTEKKIMVTIGEENREITCPDCKGYGGIGTVNYSTAQGRIKEINHQTWADGRQFRTSMYVEPSHTKGDETVQIHTGEFFKTRKECDARINELLNELAAK